MVGLGGGTVVLTSFRAKRQSFDAWIGNQPIPDRSIAPVFDLPPFHQLAKIYASTSKSTSDRLYSSEKASEKILPRTLFPLCRPVPEKGS